MVAGDLKAIHRVEPARTSKADASHSFPFPVKARVYGKILRVRIELNLTATCCSKLYITIFLKLTIIKLKKDGSLG